MPTLRELEGKATKTGTSLIGARLARGDRGVVADILRVFDETRGSYALTAERMGITYRYLFMLRRQLGLVGEMRRIYKSHRWTSGMHHVPREEWRASPLCVARTRGDRDTVVALLKEALRKTGTYGEAATLLGVGKTTVHRYVHELGLVGYAKRQGRMIRRMERPLEKTMRPKNVCHLTKLKATGDMDQLRAVIVNAIQASEGNLAETARTLGVSLNTVHRYVKELGLEDVVDTARGDEGALRAIGREAVSRRG